MTDLPPVVRIVIEIGLGAMALGVVVGVLSFVTILARTVLDRSALILPRTFKGERTKDETGRRALELDCAWPWYFRRQLFADTARIEDEREAVNNRLWQALGRPVFNKPTGGPRWVLAPYAAIALPFLLCVFVAMLACDLLYLAVAYVALGIAWAAFAITVGVLRGGEAAWLRFRRTSASCPKCFFVSKWPAYRCAGCGALHRDIRPGRLGVFERRCECGEVMDTMVLRAAWSEEAVCQRCGEPLREGAAAVRDVRVPIFGDVSAGKTRLLYASLDSVTALAEEHSLPLDYPDPDSTERAETALSTIRASLDTTKTDVTLPRALSFRLGAGNNSTLIHLYDAAGELYRSTDRYDDVSFLDNGHGLIYVIDPFALRTIRNRVAGHAAAVERVADGEGKDPELAYSHVVGQLRDGGVEARSQRLAIVVSKADALCSSDVELPTESTEIARWLHENGLHNVVLAAPNEFAEVKYFSVASIAAEHATRETDAGAPLRWLLRRQGVPLPEEAEPVVVSEAIDE